MNRRVGMASYRIVSVYFQNVTDVTETRTGCSNVSVLKSTENERACEPLFLLLCTSECLDTNNVW